MPTDIGNIGLPGDELPTPPAPAVSLPQLSMDAALPLDAEPALAADPAPPMADLAIDVETDLAVHVELMDLGLEPLSPPGVAAVQVTVDVLGELFVGAAVPLSMDDDDLLSLNERHAIRLPEGSRLRARVAEALGGADEDSDVFFVVHAVDDFDSGGEQGKELGSAHLNLRSLATEEADDFDTTLELLDEAGKPAGALSVNVRAAEAVRALCAASRPPLAAPPPLAPPSSSPSLHEVALSFGELQLWPEASRDAAALSTSGAELFVAIEWAALDRASGGAPQPRAESPSVSLRRLSARFDAKLALALPTAAEPRRRLRAALAAAAAAEVAAAAGGVAADAMAAAAEEGDVYVLLLRESDEGAVELGCAFVSVVALLGGGSELRGEALSIVTESGAQLGRLSCDSRCLAALLALESHPTLPSFAELPAAAAPAAEPPAAAAPPAAPAGRPTLNPALQRARNANATRRLPPVRPPPGAVTSPGGRLYLKPPPAHRAAPVRPDAAEVEERRQYLRTRREMLSVQLAPLPKQGDAAAELPAKGGDAPPPPPPGEPPGEGGTDPSPKARAAEEGGKAAVRRILAEELGQTVGWRRPD